MTLKKKYIPQYFNYTRSDDFAAFLSAQAAKGWRLKSLGLFMEFERAEPANDVFSVQILLDNGDMEYIPNPYTEEFSEYCQKAGWEFVAGVQKWLVFRRLRDDALPIYSPVEEITNIREAETRAHRQRAYTSGILVVMYLIFMNRGGIIPTRIPLLVFFVIMTLISLGKLIYIKNWERKMRLAFQEQGKVYFGRNNTTPSAGVIYYPFLAAALIIAFFAVRAVTKPAVPAHSADTQTESITAEASYQEPVFEWSGNYEPVGSRVNNGYWEVVVPEGWTLYDWKSAPEDYARTDMPPEEDLTSEGTIFLIQDELPGRIVFKSKGTEKLFFSSWKEGEKQPEIIHEGMSPGDGMQIDYRVNDRVWTGVATTRTIVYDYNLTENYVELETAEDGIHYQIRMYGGESRRVSLEDDFLLTVAASLRAVTTDYP